MEILIFCFFLFFLLAHFSKTWRLTWLFFGLNIHKAQRSKWSQLVGWLVVHRVQTFQFNGKAFKLVHAKIRYGQTQRNFKHASSLFCMECVGKQTSQRTKHTAILLYLCLSIWVCILDLCTINDVFCTRQPVSGQSHLITWNATQSACSEASNQYNVKRQDSNDLCASIAQSSNKTCFRATIRHLHLSISYFLIIITVHDVQMKPKGK